MAKTLQPVTYGPQATPAWSSGSRTDLLGLDRATLAWWTRWRDADASGRRHLERTTLNRRQADALARLERNLIELGMPGSWFEESKTALNPFRLREGILDQLLAGLAARPDCVPDLVRACRLPEAACHHSQALTDALIAHLRPQEEPTARPASQGKAAAATAAPTTTNNEKGTHMAISREAQRTARATLIEMHATGEVDLREALPKGFTERMQHATGIEQKAWRESAQNLSIRADKLPEFGSKPRDPNAHLVNGANGTNGHHPEPAPEAPSPYAEERAKYATKTAHINALAAERGLLAPGAVLTNVVLDEIAERVDTTRASVDAILRNLRKRLTQSMNTPTHQNGTNGHAPAAPPQGAPPPPLLTEPEPTPEVGMVALSTIIGDNCGHVWFTSEGEACPRCQLIQERDQAREAALTTHGKLTGITQHLEASRQTVAHLETLLGMLARYLGVDQADQIQPAVGALRAEAEALRTAANFMADVCRLVERADPERAVRTVQAYVLEQRDANGLLDEFGIDGTDGEGSPATLRQRLVWLIQEQLRTPPAAPVTALAPVEPSRPASSYQLTEEDRKAVLRAAADQGMAPSTTLEQRVARAQLLNDILGVALR